MGELTIRSWSYRVQYLPRYTIHILLMVLLTFLKVMTRRNCWTIRSFLNWWSFPLFSLSFFVIWGLYGKEKLVAGRSLRAKGLNEVCWFWLKGFPYFTLQPRKMWPFHQLHTINWLNASVVIAKILIGDAMQNWAVSQCSSRMRMIIMLCQRAVLRMRYIGR